MKYGAQGGRAPYWCRKSKGRWWRDRSEPRYIAHPRCCSRSTVIPFLAAFPFSFFSFFSFFSSLSNVRYYDATSDNSIFTRGTPMARILKPFQRLVSSPPKIEAFARNERAPVLNENSRLSDSNRPSRYRWRFEIFSCAKSPLYDFSREQTLSLSLGGVNFEACGLPTAAGSNFR